MDTDLYEESAKEQSSAESRKSFREIHSAEKFSGEEGIAMTASAQGEPGLQPCGISEACGIGQNSYST